MVFWLWNGSPLILNCYPFISTLYKLGYVFVEEILSSHLTKITLKHFIVRLYEIIKMYYRASEKLDKIGKFQLGCYVKKQRPEI